MTQVKPGTNGLSTNDVGEWAQAGSGSADFTGYVRPIPVALYSCHYCAGECAWLPEDLWWSELDKAWVCDTCWFDRDSNWDGENYIENSRGISLAAEIKRRT